MSFNAYGYVWENEESAVYTVNSLIQRANFAVHNYNVIYHCHQCFLIYEGIELLFLQWFGGHQFCRYLYLDRPRSAVTTLERKKDSVGNF